jgi:hypothetical protein
VPGAAAALPVPSQPRNTIEVNPWTTGKKFPAINATCGDAIVFTWTPSTSHGVVRPVAGPGKNGSCPCPSPAGNGTVSEALMLAPVTKGGSYRYIVINESEPFCVTSQAQGDCEKGMVQRVVPSCPLAPPSASSAAAAAVPKGAWSAVVAVGGAAVAAVAVAMM